MHYFHENLAIVVGLHESVFLQNLYYLLKRRIVEIGLEKKKNLWIKLSSTRLSEFQPYFTRSQLRTICKNLLELGIIQSEKKHLQYNSNTLSYTLTPKGWAYMIFLDSSDNQERIIKAVEVCKEHPWAKQGELWLFLAKTLAKSDRPWLNLAKDWSNLANIYIEDRYLIDNIENYNNILKTLDSSTFINKKFKKHITNRKVDILEDEKEEEPQEEYLKKFRILDEIYLEKGSPGEGALSPKIALEKDPNSIKSKGSFELEINRIFENSYEFKRKVLKTFEGIEDFKEKVLYPSVEKYSYCEVIKALKKVSQNFFGYMSPVAEFFAVLNGLK